MKIYKYPYKKLTKFELEKVKEYKEQYNLTDNDIYVIYTTEESLGVGYDIIVTNIKPYKKNNIWYYGDDAENITDIDNLLDNF